MEYNPEFDELDDNEQVHINVLVKLLQKYKKYETLTQEEIVSMFDTVEDMEEEVNRLIDTQQTYQENVALYNQGQEELKQDLLSSVMFANNKDITYYILLNSDIKTIYRYCLSNTAANKVCKDKSFWNTKIQQDIFKDTIQVKPFFSYRAYIEKYPEVYNFYTTRQNVNWLEKYDVLNRAKKYADYILAIYDIEYKNNKNQEICITTVYYLLLLALPLSQTLFDKYYKSDMKNKLCIKYTSKKDFRIFIHNNKGQPITALLTTLQIKEFLIKVMYYTYIFAVDTQIVDNNPGHTPYIVDQDIEIDDVSRRKGMFQVLDNTNEL